jgi:hypothetical protein
MFLLFVVLVYGSTIQRKIGEGRVLEGFWLPSFSGEELLSYGPCSHFPMFPLENGNLGLALRSNISVDSREPNLDK